MLCTSQEGGSARLIDAILRWGVIGREDGSIEPYCPPICYSDDQILGWRGGKGRLLVENYSSPLEERDVEISGPGQPFDFLGRYFCQDKRDNETLSYRLKRWENSIVSLVEPRIAGGSLDEEGIARCAQQIRSFRHENRFNPQALEKLELAIAQYDLSVPDGLSKPLGSIFNFDSNIDNHSSLTQCTAAGTPLLHSGCEQSMMNTTYFHVLTIYYNYIAEIAIRFQQAYSNRDNQSSERVTADRFQVLPQWPKLP